PINPSTIISYELNHDGFVQLQLFDVAGRLVKVLVQEEQLFGRHQLNWNGRNEDGQISAAGVYFYQLIAEGQNQTRRMVLVK
ncbi:MAG: T9SS type A sorting domain-containing protein, partial [Deltaproteobacteria bacterium]|nr:T9SS type A sorting domain-containing protein [Deltaproteobacteria bacterium]